MKVYTFLTDGFETVEALAVIDILRRAGIEVETVSITGNEQVCSAQNITVKADTLFRLSRFVKKTFYSCREVPDISSIMNVSRFWNCLKSTTQKADGLLQSVQHRVF